jgi:hypothetical protein
MLRPVGCMRLLCGVEGDLLLTFKRQVFVVSETENTTAAEFEQRREFGGAELLPGRNRQSMAGQSAEPYARGGP